MGLMAILCDSNGVSKGSPITEIISCSVVPESMDEFPSHDLEVSANNRKNLRMISVLDTVKIVDTDISSNPLFGTIAWGVILDPEQQITEAGDTIKITMPDITEQCRWTDTGIGWVAANTVSVIAQRLGSLRPGWSAKYTDTTGFVPSASPADWNIFGTSPAIVTPDGATVKKIGRSVAWDAIAYTSQIIARNPCSFTFRAVEVNTHRAAGFTKGLNTGGLADLNYGIYLQQNQNTGLSLDAVGDDGFKTDALTPTASAFVIENGAVVPNVAVSYQAGDYFTVGIDAPGFLRYYKNGVPFYTSGLVPSFPLAGFAILYTPGATIDNGMVMGSVTPDQAWWALRFEKQTILGALTDFALKTFKHIRTGRDLQGCPIRGFEIGAFGDKSAIRLQSPDGFASKMAANPNIRIITEISRKTNGSALCNRTTPLGANNGDAQVDLEYAYRAINDAPRASTGPNVPAYPGFAYYVGKFPPGQSPFPEYDAQYPIRKTPALDGRTEYYITTTLTDIPAGQEMVSSFEDSTFSYVDSTDINRLTTARGLYSAAVAKLKWEAYIHETITLKTVASGRPPRAGQQVYVNFKRINQDKMGTIQEMTVQGWYYVMQVKRAYDSSGKGTDEYTLTKNGKWPDTAGTRQANNERQIQALQMVPRTNIAMFPVIYGPREIASGDASHDFSVQVPVDLPHAVQRVQTASLIVELGPHRATTTAAGVINEGPSTSFTLGLSTPGYTSITSSGGYSAQVFGNTPGNTGNIQGGPNGSYTGPVIGTLTGTSSTGGVAGNPYGGTRSSGVFFNPYGGSRTSGSTKPTALAGDVSFASGNSNPAPSVSVGNGSLTGAAPWFNWFDNHGHNIPIFGGNSNPDASQNLWYKGDSRVFAMAHSGQGQVASGGPSTSIPTFDSLHGHSGTGGSVNLSHSTNIDGIHDYEHGHDQTHNHNADHLQLIDHYHLFPHIHNIEHQHYMDHYHSMPHTHQMVPGIFESQKPYKIQVWIDSGDGQYLDRSPYLYDKRTNTYGPFTDSFEIEDIAQFVNFPGRTVRIKLVSIGSPDTSNPLGLGSVFVHGTWIVELSGTASIIFAS